jgi:hypothetical protein
VETKETLIKAGGFTFAFALGPLAVSKLITKAIGNRPMATVGGAANAAFLVELATGCLLYSSLPTISNLLFRKK